jgi:hypothetical protein
MAVNPRQILEIQPFDGQFSEHDKDANFKHEMSLYSRVDPLKTLDGLSRAIDVPVGAVAHYVLAKWASEGASGILEVGPTMIKKLDKICQDAENSHDDEDRLAAFSRVRQIISWLKYPLDHPEVYE